MKYKISKMFLLSLMTLSAISCSQAKKEDVGPIIIEDKFIVQNGLSPYYIVNTKNPLLREATAASELNLFMKEATGCDLPIINEENVRSSYNYISLGNTTQFKEAFPDYDESILDLTQSAYFISTKNDNIYIISSDDYNGDAVLYGVYDLLHDLVDYTYYHDTEIYVKKTDTVNLVKYDDKFIFPSFDSRSISTLYTMNDDVHTQRLRLINNSRGFEWCRSCYGHSQIGKILGPWDLDENGVRYGDSHPDWFYDPNMDKPAVVGGMIDNCWDWSAGEEMEHVVAQRVIEYIKNEPKAIYFMIAQEDTHRMVNSERFNNALKEYGGTPSGLQIDFMNHVIEECEEWINTNQPGREIQYLVFAYQPTLEAPVKKDSSGASLKDSNGNSIPYSNRVIPHKKLRIFFAPIGTNYAFTFNSPINKEVYGYLKDWGSIAKNQIITYLYDLNYRNYFVNFNNFGTVAGMYKECKEAGATYCLTQGISDSNASGFDEMRSYVESRIMWNLDLNYDELAFDFMEHFYKIAADNMKNIYNILRNRYVYYQTLVQQSTGGTTGNLANQNVFPFGIVRKMDEQIHLALEKVETLKEDDYGLYVTLKNRVMKEYLDVIYLKLRLYRSNYSDDDVSEMLETFNFYTQLFGIIKSGEGIDINGIFD